MSSGKAKTTVKHVTHTMTLWPDMDIQIDKPARMGVRASVSRSDFSRLCEARKLLERVGFLEIRFIRKGGLMDADDSDVRKLLSKLSDDMLRDRARDMMVGFDRELLEKVYLVLLSYAGKGILV